MRITRALLACIACIGCIAASCTKRPPAAVGPLALALPDAGKGRDDLLRYGGYFEDDLSDDRRLAIAYAVAPDAVALPLTSLVGDSGAGLARPSVVLDAAGRPHALSRILALAPKHDLAILEVPDLRATVAALPADLAPVLAPLIKDHVDDRSSRAARLNFSEIRTFRAGAAGRALGVPVEILRGARDAIAKELASASAALTLPATPEAFDSATVGALEAAFSKALPPPPSPLPIPGSAAADPRFTAPVGGELISLPSLWTLGAGDELDRVALEAYGSDDRGELLLASESPDRPRLLAAFASRPLVHVRLRFGADRPDGAGWTPQRTATHRDVLAGLLGSGGLRIIPASRRLRPEAQRELLVTTLDETLRQEAATDAHGRIWQGYSFELFDDRAIETWCLPLPQAVACVTTTSPLRNLAATAAARRLVVRHRLSRFVVAPAFWDVEAVADFQALAGDKGMKMTTDDGSLDISDPVRGLRIRHTGEGRVAMVRTDDGSGDVHQVVRESVGGAKSLCEVPLKDPKAAYCVEVRPSASGARSFEVAREARQPYAVEVRPL